MVFFVDEHKYPKRCRLYGMADLRSAEKAKFQKFFEMGGGYVCNFSNRTFADFVAESVDIDIYDDKYVGLSSSKGARLREFWEKENNQIVARLLDEMLDYWKSELTTGITGYGPFNQILYDECKKIVVRMIGGEPVDDADALVPNSSDKDLALLSKSIKESLDKGEFEQALDRLHTFVVKYLRTLCAKHGLTYDKKTPLNALIGGYVKFLRDKGFLESEMTMRIMKSTIGVLESFDFVRNEQSLAHDNTVLNRPESVVIFNYVSSTIRFLTSMEKKMEEANKKVIDDTESRAMKLDEFISDMAMDEAAEAQFIDDEIERRLEGH